MALGSRSHFAAVASSMFNEPSEFSSPANSTIIAVMQLWAAYTPHTVTGLPGSMGLGYTLLLNFNTVYGLLTPQSYPTHSSAADSINTQ